MAPLRSILAVAAAATAPVSAFAPASASRPSSSVGVGSTDDYFSSFTPAAAAATEKKIINPKPRTSNREALLAILEDANVDPIRVPLSWGGETDSSAPLDVPLTWDGQVDFKSQVLRAGVDYDSTGGAATEPAPIRKEKPYYVSRKEEELVLDAYGMPDFADLAKDIGAKVTSAKVAIGRLINK